MKKDQEYCFHDWILDLRLTSSQVYCAKCYLTFKPKDQQLVYRGITPDKFKTKTRA
jgi:hypothetical protein